METQAADVAVRYSELGLPSGRRGIFTFQPDARRRLAFLWYWKDTLPAQYLRVFPAQYLRVFFVQRYWYATALTRFEHGPARRAPASARAQSAAAFAMTARKGERRDNAVALPRQRVRPPSWHCPHGTALV